MRITKFIIAITWMFVIYYSRINTSASCLLNKEEKENILKQIEEETAAVKKDEKLPWNWQIPLIKLYEKFSEDLKENNNVTVTEFAKKVNKLKEDVELEYFHQETKYIYNIQPNPIIVDTNSEFYMATNENDKNIVIQQILKNDVTKSEFEILEKMEQEHIISIEHKIGNDQTDFQYVYIVFEMLSDLSDFFKKFEGHRELSYFHQKTNHKYKIQPNPIGTGKYKVYEAKNTDTKKNVAIRKILKNDVMKYKSESEILNKMNQGSIISDQKIIGYGEQDLQYIYIVFEILKDDIADFVKKFDELLEDKELKYFQTEYQYNIQSDPIRVGICSKVYKAKNEQTKKDVAITKILKNEGTSESDILKKMHHDHEKIISFPKEIGHDLRDFQYIYIVSEILNHKSFDQLLETIELPYFHQETNHKYEIELNPMIQGTAVYKAKNKETDEFVVIKKVLKNEDNLEKIESEIKIMNKLKHDKIVSLRDVIGKNRQDFQYVYIITLFTGDDFLEKFLLRNKKISEEDAKIYLKQIVEGLQYLHRKNIVHRDLKLENIVLGEEKSSLKIIDFGIAHELGIQKSSLIGTPSYMAPELWWEEENITSKVDVWALGVVLYEMLFGRDPWYPLDEKNLKKLSAVIKQGEFGFPKYREVSSEAQDLLRKILKVDIKKRITLDQILEHSWFQVVHDQ